MVKKKEKILFCIDGDIEASTSELSSSKLFEHKPKPAVELIKSCINVIINAKMLISDVHTFGICTMGNTVTMVQPFTRSKDLLRATIRGLSATQCCEDLDTKSLMNILREAHEPDCTLRVIIYYCRSKRLDKRTLTNPILNEPNVFIDVIFLYNSENHPRERSQAVYNSVVCLANKRESLVFNIGSNATRLFRENAQLIRHPLEREKVNT